MSDDKLKKSFQWLVGLAGITVNGAHPYDIQVKNDELYGRVLNDTALGLGESYMDQWWECRAIDTFIEKILRADLLNKVRQDSATAWQLFKARALNLQTPCRSFIVGRKHYDIGNDLYQAMLDKRMQYTCGYWEAADNLESAQKAKLELICRKIGLRPGMKVLELGCGFGGFARYAARKYDSHVTGFTVSKEQAKFAEKMCDGLPVDIRHDDYRNASGEYDRVVSIGMMEHVGYKNYRAYMELTHRLLKDDGIAFVHTIGGNTSRKTCNNWTLKYVFPNSSLPSIAQLGKAMEGLFVVEDWHNFGQDYDKTLMAWYENFKQAWPGLKHNYNERFYRMWEYYLLSCAGGFRSRSMQVWQIIMTKSGSNHPDCRFT
jgi:cyclopropane-fatty-acyl-phospholipid synthase